MQVLITGATGFLGKHIINEFLLNNIAIIAVSRDARRAAKSLPAAVRTISYDTQELKSALATSDVVINLAGESISGKRWTSKKKASIVNSRLNAAQRLLHAIKLLGEKKLIFIQASAIGYYGDRSELNLHEESGAGEGFLSEVVRKWEAHMPELEKYVQRAITTRIGVVLGKEGGFLKEMIKQSKRGTAGKIGNGKQWISWIHIYDLVHALKYLIIDDKAEGVYNVVAPKPLQQKEFSRLLARKTGRWFQPPAPAFMIKLVLGQMGKELVLSGQHVSSSKLIRQGFLFKFEEAQRAMDTLFQQETGPSSQTVVHH